MTFQLKTLEAMQNTNAVCQKINRFLKLNDAYKNLVRNCLHICADASFRSFRESYAELLEKNGKKVVGGPSNLLPRNAVADEGVNQKNVEKIEKFQFFCWIDACQLYRYSQCKPMATEVHTFSDMNLETIRFTAE